MLKVVPGSVARVRSATVRAAVVEYVTTGRWPTAVTWKTLDRAG